MKYFAYLFLLLMLVTCGSEDVPEEIEEPTTLNLTPLAVGNEWVYIDSMYLTDGTADVTKSVRKIVGKGEYSYKGKSIELFHEVWVNKTNNDSNNYYMLCRNEENGFFQYGFLDQYGSHLFDKQCYLKYPVFVGDRWDYKFFLANEYADTVIYGTGLTITKVWFNTDADFQTPEKKYTCYEYFFEQNIVGQGWYHFYFAEDTGLVGVKHYYKGELIYTRTLLSCELY